MEGSEPMARKTNVKRDDGRYMVKVYIGVKDGKKSYKYVYGNFKTKDKAASELGSVRKKFPEAFVVKVSGTTVTRAK